MARKIHLPREDGNVLCGSDHHPLPLPRTTDPRRATCRKCLVVLTDVWRPGRPCRVCRRPMALPGRLRCSRCIHYRTPESTETHQAFVREWRRANADLVNARRRKRLRAARQIETEATG